MESEKVIGADEKTYELQPIRAGQMRDMSKRHIEAEKAGESAAYMDDNFFTIKYCLENAGMKITMSDIEAMDYPTYKLLLTAAQKISGFIDEKKPGESLAL